MFTWFILRISPVFLALFSLLFCLNWSAKNSDCTFTFLSKWICRGNNLGWLPSRPHIWHHHKGIMAYWKVGIRIWICKKKDYSRFSRGGGEKHCWDKFWIKMCFWKRPLSISYFSNFLITYFFNDSLKRSVERGMCP